MSIEKTYFFTDDTVQGKETLSSFDRESFCFYKTDNPFLTSLQCWEFSLFQNIFFVLNGFSSIFLLTKATCKKCLSFVMHFPLIFDVKLAVVLVKTHNMATAILVFP